MLLLLFLLSVASDSCRSQYVYNGLLPYDPRYAAVRRPPVRRSAIEALERLRLPVARYFPQVDTQAAPAPYPGNSVPLSAYQLAPGDIYALTPQWSQDYAPQPEVNEDEGEYGNYEYESYNPPAFRPAPVYAEEIYPQEADNSAEYNDFVEGYLMNAPQQQQPPQVFDNVQRRSDGLTTTQSKEASANASTTPTAPMSSQPSAPVQMTAVPASPEKKNVKSLIVPDPVAQPAPASEWRDLGQKEEPLFRPLQSSQRTTWSEGSPLTRAKNTQHKSPIPLLKHMIQSGREMKSDDPLLEELANLKKHPGL